MKTFAIINMGHKRTTEQIVTDLIEAIKEKGLPDAVAYDSCKDWGIMRLLRDEPKK